MTKILSKYKLLVRRENVDNQKLRRNHQHATIEYVYINPVITRQQQYLEGNLYFLYSH